MTTKNNPGQFDCYANAKPDEPMFILLGRDKDAPALVRAWAKVREEQGEDSKKVEEARACADAMEEWRGALDYSKQETYFLKSLDAPGRQFVVRATNEQDAIVDANKRWGFNFTQATTERLK